MAAPDIVLLTKADCHLCTEARAAVGRVTAALGIEWTERGIDGDPDLRDRFAEEIPVWKIDEQRLERTIRKVMEA